MFDNVSQYGLIGLVQEGSAHTYSFPIHNNSWLVSNAKVVTGVGRARRPGGGRGIRATCRQDISDLECMELDMVVAVVRL